MESEKVDILLATYNGAKYLNKQLSSIANQSYGNWHMYIRDDGSSDDTIAIAQNFQENHPDKVSLIVEDKNLGASGNFSRLMELSKSDYIMFSDQDDIWLPNKIELSLKRIKKIENGNKTLPVYVFSDLKMINEKEELVAESLWKNDKLNPSYVSLSRLLIQNVPYGCASIINKSLLEIGTPVSSKALLHDHWLSIIASAAEKIEFIKEPTILHRIHGENASRSKNPHSKERGNPVKKIEGKNFIRYFALLQSQAEGVLERIRDRRIEIESEDILSEFINLKEKGPIARKWTMFRGKYYKHSVWQSLKWILRV